MYSGAEKSETYSNGAALAATIKPRGLLWHNASYQR